MLEYITALWESQASFDEPEKIQVERMKKFMNSLGEGVGPERRSPHRPDGAVIERADPEIVAPNAGTFLHQIRRAETTAVFFRICREFLDHDQPEVLEPAHQSQLPG